MGPFMHFAFEQKALLAHVLRIAAVGTHFPVILSNPLLARPVHPVPRSVEQKALLSEG